MLDSRILQSSIQDPEPWNPGFQDAGNLHGIGQPSGCMRPKSRGASVALAISYYYILYYATYAPSVVHPFELTISPFWDFIVGLCGFV